MRHGLLLAALALGLGLVSAPATHAEAPRTGSSLPEMSEALGLDDATRRAVRAILEDSWVEGRAQLSEQAAATHALRRLLRAPHPDPSALRAASDRLSDIQAAVRAHRIETLIAIRAALSPEQRERLAALQGPAAASERMPPLASACAEDAARFCPDLEEGTGLRWCLVQNRAEVSEGCRAAFVRGR